MGGQALRSPASINASGPAEGKMTTERTSPKYDVATVECAILEVAAELHPQPLSADGFPLKIVGDPDDSRELETVAQAIRNLREFGLLRGRDDEIVELTPAALRAVALLAG